MSCYIPLCSSGFQCWILHRVNDGLLVVVRRSLTDDLYVLCFVYCRKLSGIGKEKLILHHNSPNLAILYETFCNA